MVVDPRKSLRYAITNFTGDGLFDALAPRGAASADQPPPIAVRDCLTAWQRSGVRFVQLREKSLPAGELFWLARGAVTLLHGLAGGRRPRLLVNGRSDVAAAAGADGVHLTARLGELHPAQVRSIFAAAGLPHCTVSVSCHTPAEAHTAYQRGADLILFGPVFEKRAGGQWIAPGSGLDRLREACAAAAGTPVLALGGVTEEQEAACVAAGAAGIAGIRLFAPKPFARA